MKPQFQNLPNHHQCTTLRDGDWIIWRCHLCPQYERRLNARTGEMKVNRGGSDAQHTGSSDGRGDVGALVENICEN